MIKLCIASSFSTIYNKVESFYFFGLSVHWHSSSSKYFSNALILMHVIYVEISCFRFEKVVYRTGSLFRYTGKSVLVHYGLWVVFKRIEFNTFILH